VLAVVTVVPSAAGTARRKWLQPQEAAAYLMNGRLSPRRRRKILFPRLKRFRQACHTGNGLQDPGTDVMILKILSPKKIAKNGVFGSKQS
jgi:hypothetical protein